MHSAQDWGTNLATHAVKINSRLNSFIDLELIICATKALRNVGVEEIHLNIPYILGARSDRQFQHGGTSYLRDVLAPIINAQNYKTVSCIDPHSDVCQAVINRLEILDNVFLVRSVVQQLSLEANLSLEEYLKTVVFVSPDAGSLKKVYKAADAVGYKGEVVVCSKYRDVNGKLSRVHVPLSDKDKGKDIIIIDDICDGGRTFINLVQAAPNNQDSKHYLIVTHGIFSAGLDVLGQCFTRIYCTNSYSDIKENKFVNQLKVV